MYIYIYIYIYMSIEIRESTSVVLGDIPQKGVVRCSLDFCLSLVVLVLCAISPLELPSLNTDLYRLPTGGGGGAGAEGSPQGLALMA